MDQLPLSLPLSMPLPAPCPHSPPMRSLPLRIGLLVTLGALALTTSLGGPWVALAQAYPTVPTHIYNGHLLTVNGSPVTSAVKIRFSLWESADYVSTDVTATGAVNTGAASFLGWQEVHTVTPDVSGYFSVKLGSVTTPLDLTTLSGSAIANLSLQIEVKASASGDTSYELLDKDTSSATVDRSSVVSVPFARNADAVGQRSLGSGSGSIPMLGSGGVIGKGMLPLGTNKDSFAIDADGTASGAITLKFGETLGKTLTYDIASSRFNFNTNLRIQGNLTVTGLINGVDILSLTGASILPLKVSGGTGLAVRINSGSYRINGIVTNFGGSGSMALRNNASTYLFFTATGITTSTVSFPTDKSYIPLAQVTTSSGAITAMTDRRSLQSDDREQTLSAVLKPEFDGAVYQGDGADNVGQLSLSSDNSALRNFYLWTSTRSSLQDQDILIRASLPKKFIRWNDSVTLHYRSTSSSTANNQLDVQIYDTNGTPVSLSGSTIDLAGTSWSTTHIEFSGNPTWTAGQEFMIRLKLQAKDAFQMHVGDLKLDYTELKAE